MLGMREGLTTKGQQVGNLWDVGIVLYLICVFRKLPFKVLRFSFNLFLGGSVPIVTEVIFKKQNSCIINFQDNHFDIKSKHLLHC